MWQAKKQTTKLDTAVTKKPLNPTPTKRLVERISGEIAFKTKRKHSKSRFRPRPPPSHVRQSLDDAASTNPQVWWCHFVKRGKRLISRMLHELKREILLKRGLHYPSFISNRARTVFLVRLLAQGVGIGFLRSFFIIIGYTDWKKNKHYPLPLFQ